MPIIHLIIILIIIGVLLWLINTYIPMSIVLKKIINIIIIVAVILWLLSIFGLFDSAYTINHSRSTLP